MGSFNLVNYSLRPSKSIQRSLVFEGMRSLQERLNIGPVVYVGFGSIWFTDFMLAHRSISVAEMVSIESDEVGFVRAKFNRPYKTVEIRKGLSSDVLPVIYADPAYAGRPWLVWLDYDKELSETVVDDIREAIERLPSNSVFLVTFNALGRKYGKPRDRADRMRALLGNVVPDNAGTADFQDGVIADRIATLTLDFMKSVAADVRRPGGFVPAFRLAYRDQTPMVTVGGFLPDLSVRDAARSLISADTWVGVVSGAIEAPHLTTKESMTLQSELPRTGLLDRNAVQALGFDLEEAQIEAFQRYYRFYPSFAQVVS